MPETTAGGTPVERVLFVTAHPDDLDFLGCAAAARWRSEGVDVRYCIVTDGDAGGSDRSITRERMREIRRAEQTAAAAVAGVDTVVFLGHPDGELYPTLEVRRDIAREIRRFRPQRVVTQTPARHLAASVYGNHPDHLATGEATLCAVYPDARNPFAHPDLLLHQNLEAHTVDEVYLLGGPDPDVFVDVTDQFELKLSALRCHRSQVGEGRDLDQLLRGWMGSMAVAGGLPEGRLAEAFRRLPTV